MELVLLGQSNETWITVALAVLGALTTMAGIIGGAIKYLYGDVQKKNDARYNDLKERFEEQKKETMELRTRSDICEEDRDKLRASHAEMHTQLELVKRDIERLKGTE